MIDRRQLMAGLGAGAALTGLAPNAQARAHAPLTWLWLEAGRRDGPDLWTNLAVAAERLGACAVVVDGAGLGDAAFADRVTHAAARGQSHGLAVHAHLGPLQPPIAPVVLEVGDHPPFAQTPLHRLSDPATEQMQARLRGLLRIEGLAGVQVSMGPSHDALIEDRIGLHVSASARLRGKAVTALAPNLSWMPRASIWDGVFAIGSPRSPTVLRGHALWIA